MVWFQLTLPTDANKGDTVEITFEDEKGDKHTVTLEKGITVGHLIHRR